MQIRCALVGMPGSGKSTVGRHLAQRLKVPFIDLDHQLEQVLKTSIRQFFEAEGEARFRDIEAQVLAEVTARPGGMVLSTGGGAVLRPENRQVLRDFGNVLYLRASPEEIFKRVKHDRTRPVPLQHGDVLVWGGPARLRFHGVRPIKTAHHPAFGPDRINLTFRRAG